MKKALIFLGVCAFLVIFVSQAAIQYFAHQALHTIQQQHQSDLDLSVDWVSADFNGMLTLHGFAITPYILKRTYAAKKVHIYFDDYLDLIARLPSLSGGEDWSGVMRIRTESGQTELRGIGLDDWLAQEIHPVIKDVFSVHACRKAQELEVEEYYGALGIDRLAMDFDIAINLDAQRGNLSVGVDLAERGRIDMYAVMPSSALPQTPDRLRWEALAFDSIQFSYVENGYFRRLSNFCTESTEWSRQGFALIAAQQWRETLASQGLVMNDRLAAMYANYMALGGKISVAMQAENRLQLGDWSHYLDRELVGPLGVQVRVNDAQIEQVALRLDSQRLMPPAPAQQPAAKDTEKSEANVASNVAVKAYVPVSLAEFVAVPGVRIRVETLDGRRVEGVLENETKKHIVVSQMLKGGKLSFPIAREDILELAQWQ